MSGYPTRYVVFDTESRSRKVKSNPPTTLLTLRLGVAVIVDAQADRSRVPRFVEFTDSHGFHAALEGMPYSSTAIHVFAHNMGFDARMVEWFRYVTEGSYSLLPPAGMKGAGRYKTPLFIGESPPFIVRLWRSDGQQFILLDTFQWLQKPLLTIGEWLEFPKGIMPSEDAPDGDWLDYCRRDVHLTHAALLKLWRFLGSIKCMDFLPTPASQAMFFYRTKFERKQIIRPKDPTTLHLDRHAYYGGRVDCFWLGHREETTHQVDVTGLYPSVMIGSQYPSKQLEVHMDRTWSDPPDDFQPSHCTAEVWLESETGEYPVRTSEGTYYCTGRVRTILCGPELEQAWIKGHVQFIGRYVRYELKPLFNGVIKYLWACRKTAKTNGDKFDDYLCKMMMNSLHGKFGQKSGDWLYQGKQLPCDKYAYGGVVGKSIENDRDFRVLAGHCYERDKGQEDPKGFVPIAAWCTSYARVFMDEIRAKCGEGNVLYQATDSLLLSGLGLAQLQVAGYVRDNELGYFHYEGSYPWVNVHGIHDLDLGDVRKRPGIRRNALTISDEIFEQEEWTGFSKGVFAGKVSSVSIATISKRIRHGYVKRQSLADGRTVPIRASNWDLAPEDQSSELLRRGQF